MHKFAGDPDHVVNYMRFIAQEVRELMAELGFRTVEEMVGRTDILQVSDRAKAHWKAKDLDLSTLLYQPEGIRTFQTPQNHKIDESLDIREILPAAQLALENQIPVDIKLPITNVNRVVGTIVGSEVSKRYGEEGLPEETITLRFTGSAGQSFGAFIPNGMSLHLTGDTNDYLGKGLSGGKLIVKAPAELQKVASQNVIAGNVALIGATSGEAYINGLAGERFAVRNSGAKVVVEGIGDHGLEYMTGGRVVILGNVGKNFGAGMSGGIAYVLADDADQFKSLCNTEMIEFETLEDEQDVSAVWGMVMNHYIYTGSYKAGYVIEKWEDMIKRFVKVIPKDYKRMMESIREHKEAGLSEEESIMSAFQANVAQGKKPTNKNLEAVMQ